MLYKFPPYFLPPALMLIFFLLLECNQVVSGLIVASSPPFHHVQIALHQNHVSIVPKMLSTTIRKTFIFLLIPRPSKLKAGICGFPESDSSSFLDDCDCFCRCVVVPENNRHCCDRTRTRCPPPFRVIRDGWANVRGALRIMRRLLIIFCFMLI